MDTTSAAATDATIIAPGVPEAGATVVSTGHGDATVVVSAGGDRTVAAGRAATIDLAQLQPRVELNVRAHNTYALAGQTVQNYLLCELSSYFAGGLSARAPVALALAIDRSGSMEGKPIEAVKTAVGLIVDQLTDADLLSIVTFGERVEVLMPASRVLNRQLIKDHVNRIQPKGTTNLYSGMATAAEQLLNAKTPLHLSRVLLLTDGEANEGIVEYADIIGEARNLRARGSTISTIGLGIEYNEELMSALAKNTGGNYYYIDAIDRIPEVFEQELRHVFGTVATNATLSFRTPEGVELTHVYGYEAARGGARTSVNLPDLPAGESVQVLAQLAMKPHPAARFRVVHCELSFRYFGQSAPEKLSGSFVVEFTQDKDRILGGIDPLVEGVMREKDIVANLRRASQMMKSDVGTATMIIQQAEAQLLAAGRTEDATLIGTALGKLKGGAVDDATKTLSVAEFGLER